MAISPYIANVRQSIGSDLLLVPSVTVLPRDDQGRVLLVQQADHGTWGTIGGSVEPDEHPEDAARRKALEEANIEVDLREVCLVTGGPAYRKTYSNGDVISYVVIAYDAVIRSGTPAPDHDETTAVGWFARDDLGSLDLGDLNRQLLHEALGT